jgi:hypothetical protein
MVTPKRKLKRLEINLAGRSISAADGWCICTNKQALLVGIYRPERELPPWPDDELCEVCGGLPHRVLVRVFSEPVLEELADFC